MKSRVLFDLELESRRNSTARGDEVRCTTRHHVDSKGHARPANTACPWTAVCCKCRSQSCNSPLSTGCFAVAQEIKARSLDGITRTIFSLHQTLRYKQTAKSHCPSYSITSFAATATSGDKDGYCEACRNRPGPTAGPEGISDRSRPTAPVHGWKATHPCT